MVETPIVILCGGNGIFVDGDSKRLPKAMVNVMGKPMLIHVIEHYLRYNFRKFVICLGYRGDELRKAFYQRCTTSFDICFVDTGEKSTTGDRVAKVKKYLLDHEHFGVTYSDTISSVNLQSVYRSHLAHGKMASLLAVHYPVRFRVIGLVSNDLVIRGFASETLLQNDYINGGYYFFRSEILNSSVFSKKGNIVLEDEILDQLVKDRQLVAFKCEDEWQCIDAERDIHSVEQILRSV